jgi:hypothetical protein
MADEKKQESAGTSSARARRQTWSDLRRNSDKCAMGVGAEVDSRRPKTGRRNKSSRQFVGQRLVQRALERSQMRDLSKRDLGYGSEFCSRAHESLMATRGCDLLSLRRSYLPYLRQYAVFQCNRDEVTPRRSGVGAWTPPKFSKFLQKRLGWRLQFSRTETCLAEAARS